MVSVISEDCVERNVAIVVFKPSADLFGSFMSN